MEKYKDQVMEEQKKFEAPAGKKEKEEEKLHKDRVLKG